MTTSATTQDRPIRSLIPARMHDMPWSRFHWMVVFGLGIAWILDGLEIQIVAAGGFQKTLGMSAAQVGLAGTVYLIGQVVGALIFGRLTDSLGPQEAVHHDPGDLPRRLGPRRPVAQHVVLLGVPLHRRHGHRR